MKIRSFWTKKCIFPMGLTYDFGQKLEIFSTLIFHQSCSEKTFWLFSWKKRTFFDYKKFDLFGTKKCIFPKGLIHDFGQKFQISFNTYFSSTWVNPFQKMHFLLLKRLNFSWLINSSCLSRKYSNSITTTSSLKYWN